MAEQATLEVQVCIGETEPTLDLQVIVASNIPPEIFVFQSTLERDEMGCPIVEFCNVASCQQMSEVPANDLKKGIAFVRKDSASLTFDSYADLDKALSCIKGDIDDLLKCWNDKLIFEDSKFILTFPTV